MDAQALEKHEWSDSELESTLLDDKEWLAIKEESLFFNESFFLRKYNDLATDTHDSKTVKPAHEEKELDEVTYFCSMIYSFFFDFWNYFE